jgi:hypothetical protein
VPAVDVVDLIIGISMVAAIIAALMFPIIPYGKSRSEDSDQR